MPIVKSIEKYVWVLNLALLFLVAYFLAGFINFQINKKYWQAQALAPRKPQATFTSGGFTYNPPSSRILDGNIFGTIPPAAPGVEGGATTPLVTSVDAELIGVIYFSMANPLNQATIRMKHDNKTDTYKEGDEVSPGANVSEIWPEEVVLKFSNGQTQELNFEFGGAKLPGTEGTPGSYVSPYITMSREERDKAYKEYRKTLGVDDQIQRLSDNYYKIQKSAINKAMGNLNEIVTQARMVPNFTADGANQKVDGFKVFNVKPGSIFDKLGIREGDIIKSINGANMDSVEKGFELMQSLKYENQFEIDIMRGGNQPVTMNYQVVD
jgi:general secretion pathway protein C